MHKIEQFHDVVAKRGIRGPFFCNAEALIGGKSCKNKLFGCTTFAFEPAAGPHSTPYLKLKKKSEKNGWPIEAGLKHLDERVKLQVMHLFVDHALRQGREMALEEKILQKDEEEVYIVVQLCRGSVEKKHGIPALMRSLQESKTITFDKEDFSKDYFCFAKELKDKPAENTIRYLKLKDHEGRVIKLDIRNGWSPKTFSENAYKMAHIVHNFTTCAILNPPCKATEKKSCENCTANTGKAILADRMMTLKQPKGSPMKLYLSQETVNNYFKSKFSEIFSPVNIESTIKATRFFCSKNPKKENRNLDESDFIQEAILVKGDSVLDIENPDHKTFEIM